jgi:hypothetical protein
MKREYKKVSDDLLKDVVRRCATMRQVCITLGKKPAGGACNFLALRCKRAGIDTSHFVGQAHNKGKRARNRNENLLTEGKPTDFRVSAPRLRKALQEACVEYKCVNCNQSDWFGHRILEVDHINGKYWDNRKDNLQLLCPNCHAVKTMGL